MTRSVETPFLWNTARFCVKMVARYLFLTVARFHASKSHKRTEEEERRVFILVSCHVFPPVLLVMNLFTQRTGGSDTIINQSNPLVHSLFVFVFFFFVRVMVGRTVIFTRVVFFSAEGK